MPIFRFKEKLVRMRTLDDYYQKLVNAFNPVAAEGVMCRNMISIDYQGKIYSTLFFNASFFSFAEFFFDFEEETCLEEPQADIKLTTRISRIQLLIFVI